MTKILMLPVARPATIWRKDYESFEAYVNRENATRELLGRPLVRAVWVNPDTFREAAVRTGAAVQWDTPTSAAHFVVATPAGLVLVKTL